jgi:hypothetical protein
MATKKQTEAEKLAEQERLIQVLKFTPRTYKICMWGYGGETVMGTVDRKIYDYFRHRRLDLSDFAWDSDYAEEHNIPDEMWPFPPGSWYECDNMAHAHGVSRNAGTLQILDENGETVFERTLEDMSGGDDDEPDFACNDEVWIDSKDPGTIVFIGKSNEKGTFFEADFELKEPFDISKLHLGYDEIDGEELINNVEYDGEELDNWGGNTDGKSSDFGMYVAHSQKDHGKWIKYTNMDDIEYEMTEWFAKKIKPAYPGVYNIKTAGKNSWSHQAKWTGSRWISSWGEDVPDTEETKIKEWQGLAADPDAETPWDPVTELEKIVKQFEDQVEEADLTDEEVTKGKWPY